MWGHLWCGQRIVIFCDNDAVCDTITYQKPKDLSLQQLLRECLFWVCKFNFYPVLQKIASKENHIADFISRNHIEDDISKYFEQNGYPVQTKVTVPLDWFNFVTDW